MNSTVNSFKGRIALSLGILVVAFSAAVVLRTQAASDYKHPINGWQVMPPVSYKNLTLFPVRANDEGPTDAYITLDEGIKSGTVIITEKGSPGIIRRPLERGANPSARQSTINQAQVQSIGQDGAVNRLVLINKSGKKLLLLAGEVIVGGKQDRIVEKDMIVPPYSDPIDINVFCVEHGRWQRKTESFASLGAISHPKLRAAAQDRKDQSAVWSEVGKKNAELGTANRTDTYQEVYRSKSVDDRMQPYIDALQRELPGKGIVGVVVAKNGEPVWADLFASSSLFSRYWPKLLKSYVVDAVTDYPREIRPSLDQAERFLREREGRTSFEGQEGVYRLTKIDHPQYAIFELEDVSLMKPLRLHFNKMRR